MFYHLLKSHPEQFFAHPLITGYWYYRVELEPEVFTPGFMFSNLPLTRHLLRRTEVAGMRCYDIGTMEGVIPTLLAKRGASKVVAMDGINYTSKIRLVQDLHGVSYDYHPNIQLDSVPGFLRNKARMDGEYLDRYDYRSDVTVIAGILYHVFSPFHLLGYARSITRKGGVVVIETAAMNRNDWAMLYNFNGAGYIYDWTDTWFPSLPLLDYMLRMCKLQPLDAMWVPQAQADGLVRIAIACRALADTLPMEGEDLMSKSTYNLDHNIFVDTFGEPERPDVPFTPSPGVVLRPDGQTCDIFATTQRRAAHETTVDEMVLRLSATW